jgi:uncharacterized membrane protein
MTNNEPERPTPAEPRIGGKRPLVRPILAVVGLVVLVVVLYLVLTWVQQNT